MNIETRTVDVVVAGSGPGGATVARAMARAGKKVLLLEKGRNHQWIGNHFSALAVADKAGLARTEEGLGIIRAITTGGSSVMFCGAATEPPAWLKTKYKIDLAPYAAETISELHLEPLPDETLGQAGMRIWHAANGLGYKFEKLRKFIDPSKCRMRCGGTCMLGCPYGAKWTARSYIDDMIAAGGELITRAEVQQVTHEDGVATGLKAFTPSGVLEVSAKTVILAAGGLGSPTILQKSGLHEAGIGMFVDPLVFVSGVPDEKIEGTAHNPPMTVGTYEFMEEGILLADLIDPWMMWMIMAVMRNPMRILDILTYRRHLGIMVKIGDERQGFITMDGRISKSVTERDRKRLNRGAQISRDILIAAGCNPKSIIVGPIRGAHPGATARIGEVVDENLQTRIKGLYVSDASVIPEALDRPVVLTAISLAKRLADHLLAQEKATA